MPESLISAKENKCESEITEKQKDATWEKDQKERSYYYDDAHGYEAFDPEGDDDEDDETDELA